MLKKIYDILLKEYGPQGWWPLSENKGKNPTTAGSIKGYSPRDYSFPKTKEQQFEICIGAILTQNTNWISVEKALFNLSKNRLINPQNLLDCPIDLLKEAVRPTGYFNQKANYLRNFSRFYLALSQRKSDFPVKIPSRKEIKSVTGIGNETADSILLYAFKQPEFIVDAYTKRIFSLFGFFDEKAKYDEVKKIFTENLNQCLLSDQEKVIVFQEYHALIVNHAKTHYNKKPYKKDKIIQKTLNSV
ncbi:MAG: endonuclease III [Candidatus Cloacimonadota bacterium]|nr:MAG: endonuclease III [Candidatus Cloacimonadota bacterium]